MTDDHAPQATDGETDSRSTADDPGGGPKRVVSEKSVDDILNSIGSEPDGGEVDRNGGESRVDENATREDGDGEDAENPSDEDGGEIAEDDGSGLDEESETEIEATAENGPDEAAETGVDEDSESDADGGVTATFDEAELGRGVPADESSENDEPRADEADPVPERADGDLADRIERGAITGADVRAAEAGEGRDPTPEIDEIELSLEDVEATAASDDGAAPTGGTEEEGAAEREAADRADRVGLVGRLKRLFSR